VASKQTIFWGGFEPKQTKTQSVLVHFWFVFFKTNNNFSGLLRFVLIFSTPFETTKTKRSVLKQSEKKQQQKYKRNRKLCYKLD
jgi:hypothetical protein